jgi:hypothetical protein
MHGNKRANLSDEVRWEITLSNSGMAEAPAPQAARATPHCRAVGRWASREASVAGNTGPRSAPQPAAHTAMLTTDPDKSNPMPQIDAPVSKKYIACRSG